MASPFAEGGRDLFNPANISRFYAGAGPGYGMLQNMQKLQPEASPSTLLDYNKFSQQFTLAREQEKRAKEEADRSYQLQEKMYGLQSGAFDLSKEKFGFQKDLTDRLFGFASNAYSNPNGTGAPQIEKGPEIKIGPVFSPEQMAQQENLVRDRSMRQAAGVGQRMQGQYAARGFGGNSPLLRAIQGNLETQGRVGGETGALQFAGQMAGENAKNLLGSQQLQQQSHDAYQQALLSRFGTLQSGRNQLLSVIGNTIGGLR